MSAHGLEHWRVPAGRHCALADFDTAARPATTGKQAQDAARLLALGVQLGELQQRLYASRSHALLLVLQGMDTSGKDGVIRRVFSSVSPLGVRAHAFGVPSPDELQHDYLWRVHARLPARGEIAIFNRSHYEDVVTVRVRGLINRACAERRLRQIRHFEAMLHAEGTVVLKCFLHISSEEQRVRLRERLTDPAKRWKLKASDLADRSDWAAFQDGYGSALAQSSRPHAPWYVVPADSRMQRDLMVAELLVQTLTRLKLAYPAVDWPGNTVIPA